MNKRIMSQLPEMELLVLQGPRFDQSSHVRATACAERQQELWRELPPRHSILQLAPEWKLDRSLGAQLIPAQQLALLLLDQFAKQ
jgi:hypothetical protein